MSFDYENSLFDAKTRALDLLLHMSIDEKIGQMMQISFNQVDKKEAEEWILKRNAGSFLHVLGDDARNLQKLTLKTRHRIPLILGIDAVHGHALHNGATIFPSQLAMSCSWDPELIEKAGRVTAKEVIADGLNMTFSPVLCIGRDLRWGRIDETFGEDPYLIGTLASALIRGYQGKNLADEDSIASCVKHYIAYGESTGGRDSYDSEVSLRKIKEIFLPPFKKAVDTGCASIMSSYQSVDGVPVSANKTILRKMLKEELGFSGFVVTDWNNAGNLSSMQHITSCILDAVYKIIDAGNDMIMNTPEFYDAAVKLVKDGTIQETLIDEAVKRILYIKFAMGLFDNKQDIDLSSKSDVFACSEHLEINLKLAQESIVLLENNNNILPVNKNVKKIAVIGPNSDDIIAMVGDWTFYSHPDPHPDAKFNAPVYTIFQGIRDEAVKRGINVVYNKGCDVLDSNEQDIKEAVKCAMESDIIIAVIGDKLDQNGESKDRADLSLSGAQELLIKNLRSLNRPLIVVLVNGKPLAVPWISENADALIETFNPGMLGGTALAQIIFGEVNPSGKLSISFPYHSGQLPVYYNHLSGWHGGKYMDMPDKPLYSFGYGLSYTNFKYTNLKLSAATCKKEDTVMVSIDVTNTGDRDGTEIVQFYVNDLVSSVMTPVKELIGFKRVEIKAGETKTVSILLPVSQLCIVDENLNYVVEPGLFEIMAGPDSRDEVLLKEILKVS